MQPTIRTSPQKIVTGMRIHTTLAENKTFELWKTFMARRKEIENTVSDELISVEVYSPSAGISQFTPTTVFEKWAAMEVSPPGSLPKGMDSLVIPAGLYAMFNHRGLANPFDYIFSTWLPGSGYEVDQRPHFAVMGEKYKNGDPDSEEELWIPVRPKN